MIHDTGREPQPVVVAVCGAEEHGKSTAAEWLEREHGFRVAPFAEPIRDALVAMTRVPRSAFSGAAKREPRRELSGMTPREAMQRLGDWGRGVSPDFWIDAWERRLTPGETLVVIDDVRYDLEVDRARALAEKRGAGFVVVRVSRPGWTAGTEHGSNRIPAVPAGVDAFDVVNSGAKWDLGGAVEAGLRERGYL